MDQGTLVAIWSVRAVESVQPRRRLPADGLLAARLSEDVSEVTGIDSDAGGQTDQIGLALLLGVLVSPGLFGGIADVDLSVVLVQFADESRRTVTHL